MSNKPFSMHKRLLLYSYTSNFVKSAKYTQNSHGWTNDHKWFPDHFFNDRFKTT